MAAVTLVATATLLFVGSPGGTSVLFVSKQSNESDVAANASVVENASVVNVTAPVEAPAVEVVANVSAIIAENFTSPIISSSSKQAVNSTAAANATAANATVVVVAPASGKQANVTAPAGNATAGPDFTLKTFGQLAAMVADLTPKATQAGADLAEMERGPARDQQKIVLHDLKTQLHEVKVALNFKKANKPVLLMTAADEPMPKRSAVEDAAAAAAATKACNVSGGHIADQQSSMCCATVCKKCGGGNPEEEQCKSEVIKAAKICTDGSTVPCMIKPLATEVSKAADAKWKSDQGLTASGGIAGAEAAKSETKAWWHIW